MAVCMRREGWNVEEVDIVHGADHDITKPRVVKQMCKIIRNGRYEAAMIAAPCTSFTVARDRTCIIRTKHQPWGLAIALFFLPMTWPFWKMETRSCEP